MLPPTDSHPPRILLPHRRTITALNDQSRSSALPHTQRKAFSLLFFFFSSQAEPKKMINTTLSVVRSLGHEEGSFHFLLVWNRLAAILCHSGDTTLASCRSHSLFRLQNKPFPPPPCSLSVALSLSLTSHLSAGSLFSWFSPFFLDTS